MCILRNNLQQGGELIRYEGYQTDNAGIEGVSIHQQLTFLLTNNGIHTDNIR